MGASGFMRARRIAAERMNKPVEEVGYQEAAEYLRKPQEEQPVQESDAGVTGEQPEDEMPTTPLPAALALINGAASAKAIEKLPTIGAKGAQKIFDVRPENGFVALEQVAAMTDLQSANWTEIAAWEAPE
ncbi:hypothetical protein [Leptolyngbya sp. FACHB-16]|uniref:hypothetical protein n=1 Tax=unclassified Leptolyngbya TaxID=2650499 RepID=UPI001682BC10|nr:hypothetical protein [Leptolyngbya sp. FACHB-16]MBD2156228.1 hypothetical protein [Leptolyngbya sp. FACHB-16]